MTTIGSTNSYSASIYSLFNKNGSNKGSGGDTSEGASSTPRASAADSLTGSETVFGAKLAETLWTMESQGVEISQDAGDTWLGKAPNTAPEQEFLGMASKTFAERIRDQYLEAHDLTEDDLKSMSADDRAAIEADIRKAILEAMGVNGDQQNAAMDMGAGAQAQGKSQGNTQNGGQQNTKSDDRTTL